MGFTTEEPFFSAERDTASRSRHKKTSSSISRDARKERKASSSSSLASTSRPGLGVLAGNTDNVHDPLAGLSSLLVNPALLAAAQQHAVGRFNPFMFPWSTNNSNGSGGHQTTNFDSLLSGFSVDPFLVPPAAIPPFGQPFGTPPPVSLPPLTIRGTEDTSPRTPTSSTSGGIFAIDPALALPPPVPASVSASAPVPAHAPTKVLASTTSAAPPTKRQKTSTAATANTDANANTTKKTTSAESPSTTSSVDENKPQPPAPRQMTPVTAAEDKRRRNTAASARFRAKKKEREAAMEHKAKGLEERVLELERECESLRKENGWLKGLVVGATAGDGVDLTGLNEMFSAVKAAAAPPSVVSNEDKIGWKRKRTTA